MVDIVEISWECIEMLSGFSPNTLKLRVCQKMPAFKSSTYI